MIPQLSAFLAMIRHSEGTAKHPDPYRVCYGEKYFIEDLRDHPWFTGEWRGESLPDKYCLALGLPLGSVSTAAGAYQMTHSTWAALKARLRLVSFSKDEQDDGCVQLIKDAGALQAIVDERVSDAIYACRKIWASLPGSTSGQPQRQLADLLQVYDSAVKTAAA